MDLAEDFAPDFFAVLDFLVVADFADFADFLVVDLVAVLDFFSRFFVLFLAGSFSLEAVNSVSTAFFEAIIEISPYKIISRSQKFPDST